MGMAKVEGVLRVRQATPLTHRDRSWSSSLYPEVTRVTGSSPDQPSILDLCSILGLSHALIPPGPYAA